MRVMTLLLAAFTGTCACAAERIAPGVEAGSVDVITLARAGDAAHTQSFAVDPEAVHLFEFTAKAAVPSRLRVGTAAEWRLYDVTPAATRHRWIYKAPGGAAHLDLRLELVEGRDATVSGLAAQAVSLCGVTHRAMLLGLGTAVEEHAYLASLLLASPEGKTHPDIEARTCSFHDACVSFAPSQSLVFAHAPPGAPGVQTGGSLVLQIEDLGGGVARIEAASRRGPWIMLAELSASGPFLAEIPDELYPSDVTRVRIASPDRNTTTFRLTRYSFVAHYAADLGACTGNWCFIHVQNPDEGPRFLPDTFRLGGLRPGLHETLTVTATSPVRFRGRASHTLTRYDRDGEHTVTAGSAAFFLQPGELRGKPFSIPCQGAGWFAFDASLSEEDGPSAVLNARFMIPSRYRDDFGVLRGRFGRVACWTFDGDTLSCRERLPPMGTPDAHAVPITLVRNQSESFFLALSAFETTAGVTVAPVGDLRGVRLRAAPVSHVFCPHPDPPADAIGFWPDRIEDSPAPQTLQARHTHLFRITAIAGPDARAGVHGAVLEISGAGPAPGRVPVTVKVLDLDLSGAPRPVVTASLDPRLFARVYGGDPGEAWANWRRAAAAAAACGIVIDNPLDAAPPLWHKDSAHDVPVKDVPASTLSDLSSGAGPAPGPYRLPVPEDVLQALCAEGEDHAAARETAQNALREVGALLARHGLGGAFYIVSRPLPARDARLLAEAATAAGMRLLLPMLPDPAITSPGILWCARLAEMARARPTVAEGQKLWAFIDATPGFPSQVLGRPGHELRALGVLAWGLGVHGIRLSGLFNAVPALAGGRPDDPLTWSDALPDGSRFLANGAGYLFLPPPAGTPNTPAPTLRAALIREAIDDWRCLELLARLLAERPEARDDGAQEEARACLAWARGLDAAPSSGELSAWRARIMDALDHLQDAAPHAR